MNLQKIEKLIEKYERGETTSHEDQVLKTYFARESVPLHLRSFKELFAFLEVAKQEKLPDTDFDSKVLDAIEGKNAITLYSNRKQKLYTILSIAASFIILFGLYFQFRGHGIKVQDTFDDPELAYAVTKKALLLVSGNLNEGVREMEKVSEFNKSVEDLNNMSTFETGLKNLEKISMLDESKKIITSKNQ